MLYDLQWLNEGSQFPPPSEVQRLVTYRDNRLLFDGEIDQVLADYRQRLNKILSNLNNEFTYNALDSTTIELNYFEALTVKTGDLVAGETPTITIGTATEENAKKQSDILDNVDFENKLLEMVYDISRFGDSISRLYIDETKKTNYLIMSPELWFPIVDRENNKKVVAHCIAWLEQVGKDVCELRVQIHYEGYYEDMTFEAKGVCDKANFRINNQKAEYQKCTIGKLVKPSEQIKTGFNDFAIIHFSNIRTSDSIYGRNDYDRICSILAELQVRYSLKSLILDKHAAPTMYGGQSSLYMAEDGTWKAKAGGFLVIEPGEQPPGYLVWDAALLANEKHIERLERHLAALSEMGAILNDDAVNSSQGFEALEIKMTNARLKARRIASKLTTPLKKLLSIVMTKNGLAAAASDISIEFNDGIPSNEFRNVNIAKEKKNAGLFDIVTILCEHFGKTKEQAEEIVERINEEMGGGAYSLAAEEV